MDLSTGAQVEVEIDGATFYFENPSIKQVVDFGEEGITTKERFDFIIDLLQKIEGLTVNGKECDADKFKKLYLADEPTKRLPSAAVTKIIVAAIPALIGDTGNDNEVLEENS